MKEKFKKSQTLKLAIDRTQWRDKNVFVISLIWNKRGIPLYWQLLDKRGSSNLSEQQALINPITPTYMTWAYCQVLAFT